MSAQLIDWRAHGLRVTHALAQYDDTALRRGSSDDDVVRLHFGMRGNYSVRYPEIGRAYDLVGGHYNMLYSRPFNLEFVNKTPTLETFGVQFPIAQFVSYVDGSNDLLSRFCEHLSRAEGAVLFERWAPMTPAIEHIIGQMLACRFVGAVRELFVLSKSLELLVLSVEGGALPLGGQVKNSNDRDKLIAARDLVNQRLSAPPTLSEVAKHVGLNEYKLKRGFREMFGTSVFAYLTERRLDLAKRWLLDSDKHAAEIAFELGYATPQHFSHAFKKRFGVAPNTMRKNPA